MPTLPGGGTLGGSSLAFFNGSLVVCGGEDINQTVTYRDEESWEKICASFVMRASCDAHRLFNITFVKDCLDQLWFSPSASSSTQPAANGPPWEAWWPPGIHMSHSSHWCLIIIVPPLRQNLYHILRPGWGHLSGETVHGWRLQPDSVRELLHQGRRPIWSGHRHIQVPYPLNCVLQETLHSVQIPPHVLRHLPI